MADRDFGHEAVEHTADLAVRAWAPDLAGLIEQAARGMLELLVEAPAEADGCAEVTAEGQDAEELLVDCLREILALWTVERRLPVSVAVTELSDRRVVCEVGVVEPAKGGLAPDEEIKAVTYHGVEIVRTEGRLEVTVVFDV